MSDRRVPFGANSAFMAICFNRIHRLQELKMAENKGVSTLRVAGTYIGTVVGAGFASGQEVLQFFVYFGYAGFFGLLAVTALFIILGYMVMDLGNRIHAQSHLDIIRATSGRILSVFSDIIITVFLFGTLSAMFAGSGALMSQQFGLHPLIGGFLMAALTIITVLSGFNGIVNSISFVVPFLLISAVGVGILSLFIEPEKTTIRSFAPNIGFLRNWLWSAILYTSYNTVISFAILGPLGARAKSRKVILRGAVLGGLGLGIGATALFFSIWHHFVPVASLEVPMIYIAGRVSPIVQIIYGIVLLAEIYTTAVGNLYGFSARMTVSGRSDPGYVIIISALCAFLTGLLGFSNLVRYLYPSVGYAGIIILICLVINRKNKKYLDKR